MFVCHYPLFECACTCMYLFVWVYYGFFLWYMVKKYWNLHMKYMCIAFCTPWAFKGWFHEFWSLEFFYLDYLIYLFSALPQYRDSIKITDITIHVFLLAHWCRIVGLPYSLSGKQTPYLISFRNLSVMLHNMIVQTYYVVLLRLILFIIKTIHVIRNVGDM